MTNETNSIEFISAREAQRAAPTSIRHLAEDHGHIHEDNAFLGSLSLRMKNADWAKYERGSEAFFDLDRDLERLAKSSPMTAAKLWEENTPPGTKTPFYLAAELEREADATRAAAEIAAKATERGEGFELPGSLKKRYLEADGKFHFRDDKNVLAFEDRGRRVVTEHNNPDVAASMVELAEAKGWTHIKVTGHDDFKREVWLQASLKNIEVTGYKPKEVDLAKLEELRATRMKNVIEQQDGKDVSPGAKKSPLIELQQRESLADSLVSLDRASGVEEPNPGIIKGKLLEHGHAHFDFDEKNEQSYYVKVETPVGTRMHWGVDLERAMNEAGVQKGERIEMERLGKEPVTVKEKEFDGAGKQIGSREVPAERVKWRVDPEGMRREPAKTETPTLSGDQKVAVTVMAEVLKEKGYSNKTITKAIADATNRLVNMEKSGEPAPRVKVFDKEAPRAIERPKMQQKSKQREAERSR